MSNKQGSRIKLFDLPFDCLSLAQVTQKIEQIIQIRKPHRLVVVNAAKVVKARKDTELRKIIQTADIIGPDGVPLVWISWLLGKPLPGRVNGTDLMEKLFELSAGKGFRIFFFGATEAVIKRTVEIVRADYPGIQIAGFRNGYFSEADEPEIVEQIRQSGADILLVGFGTPKKEFWIAKYRDRLNVPFIHGVGGSFDVVAGITKRAPVWMQKYGLEWFFRFLQEPRRMWKRYLVTNSVFIWLCLKEIAKCHFPLRQKCLNPESA